MRIPQTDAGVPGRMADRQRGATLIVTLLFLIVISVLGASAWTIGLQEERMSGITRDQQLAFESAEAALRDAERDLLALCVNGASACNKRPYKVSGATGFGESATNGTCTKNGNVDVGAGLCLPVTPNLRPNWGLLDRALVTQNPTAGQAPIAFGTYTTTGPLPTVRGVGRTPQYVIEFLCTGGGQAAPGACPESAQVYRVSAVGFGNRQSTRVYLESYFKFK